MRLSPITTLSEPSVTMKSGILTQPMKVPLMAPTASPVSTAMAQHTRSGIPL